MARPLQGPGSWVRTLLPRGLELPEDQWQRRHRVILAILWLHVVGLVGFAVFRGNSLAHSLLEGAIIAVCAAAASQRFVGGRRFRSIATAAGLVASSAVLVHLSGGVIEMHFHFFVVVGIITLYQDWTVFVTAIVFVALHHGGMGVIDPHAVYNHQGAHENPWKWAAIHAVFVLAASAAQVTSWRFAEDQYHRAEAGIRARDRRFRSLIENSSDGISVIGSDGTIVYDSPSVATILGNDPSARVGTSAFASIHPDDLEAANVIFRDMVTGDLPGTVSLELRARHADGSWRYLEARVKNLLATPDVQGIVANFRDVTDRKNLEDQLSHRAFHDVLTELPNRALFLDRVSHAIATSKRTQESFAVLFVDLDDFKTVNDGLGHAAGDEVLITVASRLKSCLREADTCARLGGDEFGALLEGLGNPAEAYEVGARILEALSDDLYIDDSRVGVNASLGIVISSGDDGDAAALVRNADLAMYQAKSSGKGRYEIFESGMHDAVVERLALKADLRRGVENDEFVAHYQPIVELATGRVTGAEALVRWHHPVRGILAPAAFLELAEETGVIAAIGATVLRQACEDAAGWARSGSDAPGVSVNLSASQLKEDGVVDLITEVLRTTGLLPSALTIEITETLLMEDPARAAETLRQLKAIGVRIALDDFGTGYSSLSYLSRFPVDHLKIDKSFVDSLAGGGAATDASLVGAIAGIGEMLNLQVTAEGIEHHAQLAELQALGCNYGQGYVYARPVPKSEFDALLCDLFPAPEASEMLAGLHAQEALPAP